jgi:uncharacterized SAM-binding protein YcdF (DUF218 family)
LGLVALFAASAWTFRNPLLRLSANTWTVSEKVDVPVDVVLVLGGGAENRTLAAYDLYHRGLTRRIAIAKSSLDPAARFELSLPETEIIRLALLKFGVPEEAITFFGNDLKSTYEEAKAAAVWASSNNIHSIAVATEWATSRRARWIFEKQMRPLGIQVKIQPTQEEWTPDNWWQSEVGVLTFQNELIKYIYYRIRY